MKNIFAENLRYLRKKSNLSQSALAQELNYSRSNIASYEFGGSEPSITRLKEISAFFNVSLDSLLFSNIEKAMYNNRIKEKPISESVNLPKDWGNALEELANHIEEIETIQKGSKQFICFKKKKWTAPDAELITLSQECDKLLDLLDFLLEKNKHFLKSVSNKKS